MSEIDISRIYELDLLYGEDGTPVLAALAASSAFGYRPVYLHLQGRRSGRT